MASCVKINNKYKIMDTTEKIHNALGWANKRLEIQGEPITENQRNYIVFALRQQFAISAVVGPSEQLPESEKLCRMNQNFKCNCIDDSRCPNF